ncbi:MAG: glycosyltransferase family 4 protein [Pseudohongiella sp.]|nr:glycosyltransferase family 4 protein [Pseudohongiella sp.]
MRDLARQFVLEGHSLTCLVAMAGPVGSVTRQQVEGYETVHVGIPNPKVNSRLQRVIAETLSPHVLKRAVKHEQAMFQGYDCIVWYSPSIFFGPLVAYLKKINRCKGYLIIRDIFPDWAVDLGLMGEGLPYRFFKYIARQQYDQADVIGVQSPGNLAYFDKWHARYPARRVEVLQNWLSAPSSLDCSISVAESNLSGRIIFVYAGNMGVAQGVGILLELAERLRGRRDVGFLFVGRGTDANRLRDSASERLLDNVQFFDEIDSTEIPGLYAQCHVGLLALDRRHRTHNIPGKFLSYMWSGLPVLACINPGNDLVELIERERVGRVSTDYCIDTMMQLAEEFAEDILTANFENRDIAIRCTTLASKIFSADAAVNQIVNAIKDADLDTT